MSLKFFSTVLILLGCWSVAYSQLSNLQIIKEAVKAAGGENWRRPKTLHLSGTATLCWEGKLAKCRRMDTYKMWRVFPDKNEEAHRANGMVRFDAFEGNTLFVRVAFDGKKTSSFFSKEAEERKDAFRWANAFGFSILRFADGEGFKLVRMTDDQVEGFPCYFIKIIDPKKNETTFAIDKRSYRIRFVGFDTPLGYHNRIYSNFKWHKNPRFIQPTRVRLYYNGVKTADIHWKKFAVNKAISDKVFSPETR